MTKDIAPFVRVLKHGYKIVSVTPPNCKISSDSRLNAAACGKAPGIRGADGSWSGYRWASHEASEADAEAWQAAGGNLGILTEYNPAIDVDVTDAVLADEISFLAREHLGPAPCRFGNRPKRLLLYKTDVPFSKMRRTYSRDDGEKHAVEILAKGQQFVCLGTHPKTGRPYEWEDGSPALETAHGDLTPITREQVEAFLAATDELMRAHGLDTEQGQSTNPGGHRAPIGAPELMGDPEIAKRALEVIGNEFEYDEWIKKAAAFKAAVGGDEACYPNFEAWCLLYKENTPEIARSKWDSISDAKVGFEHLINSAIYALREHGEDAQAFRRALSEYQQIAMSQQNAGNTVAPSSHKAQPLTTEILNPPGLVGDIARYHDDNSQRITPIFGLAAGLTTVSALARGHFALVMPSGLVSTNLFILAMGGSGSGKEGIRSIVKRSVTASGADERRIGSAASAQALIRDLQERPDFLWMPDEFGRLMKFAGVPTGGHEYQLISQAMKLYGLAFSSTERHVYSDQKKNLDPVYRPYLSVLATCTEVSLTEALTSSAVVNGTLNRFIVIALDDPAVPFRDGPTTALDKVTKSKLETIGALTVDENVIHDHDLLGLRRITPDDDARDRFLEFRSEADDARVRAERAHLPSAPLWARAYENALRIGAVVAVGDNDDLNRATLRIEHADWAIRFMRWSIDKSIRLLRTIGDTAAEKDSKKILEVVRELASDPESTVGWVTKAKITRKTQQLDPRQRDIILSSLVEGGYLEAKKQASSTKSAMLYRIAEDY